ncbi:MAG TPA: fibronectin type III domain-containing protein, partial [Dehalococcoidia bacterium]|nr:fibronectin type III domain-containing protein [Dehalococcoidia bacterium]
MKTRAKIIIRKIAAITLATMLLGLLLMPQSVTRVSGLESTGQIAQMSYATAPAINAPANLAATALSPSQIRLNWQDMSDNEIRFRIERRTGRSDYFTINIVGSNVTEYLDSHLNPGSTYYYRVIANGISGDSSPSNEAMGNTLGPPAQVPVLLSPGNYSIISTVTPRLTWSAAENAATYSIQISRDYGFTNLLADDSGITEI